MNYKVRFGYFQPLEKVHPSYALDLAVTAERLGFDMIATADHFHPWWDTNAYCGFAWSWLSVVLARTSKVICGTCITAPILRYHPAIIAQAWTTMYEMFPGRVFLGLGTGEAINEVPLGFEWPTPSERVERLEEAVKIIKLLWTSESPVTFNGKYYKLRHAKLYPRPSGEPLLLIAAGGMKTAEIAGKYADGIITVPEHFKPELFERFENSAKKSGRDPAKLSRHLDISCSYDEDYDKALEAVKPKAGVLLPIVFKYAIYNPIEIESYAKLISDEAIKSSWIIFTDYEEPIKIFEKYIKLGFTHFHIESQSPDEKKFLTFFGQKVLPYLKETYGDSS
jgi:coenzyme F420-dependent glucose-6-phosphate dehydrogenase